MAIFSKLSKKPQVPADARSYVLLARSRSGTTVFRALLDTHRSIQTFGEIFNEGNQNSYYHFLASRVGRNPKLLFPSNSEQNLLDYFEDLKQRGVGIKDSARVFVFDLKYGLARHLVKPWQIFLDPPYIFECLRANDIGVIHLVRRNYLRVHLSNELMQLRDKAYDGMKGKYHIWANDTKAKAHLNQVPDKVRIGGDRHVRGQLLNFFGRMDDETESVRKFFADSENFLEICYEDLFEVQKQTQIFSPKVITDTSTFLGVEEAYQIEPKILKATSQPLEDLIENYEEVARALEGTPYAWFLNDSPTN